MPLFFQAFLNLGDTFLKLALIGTCPAAQNQSHGQVVCKFMLLTECDGSISLTGNNCSIAAKLMNAKTHRSCNCFTERVLRCIGVSASLSTKSQRLIWIAEYRK